MPVFYANVFPLNWVDVLMGIVISSIVIKGRKSDFFTEIISFFGILTATFISVHYYARLGSAVGAYHEAFGNIGYLIAFGLLNVFVIALFFWIRDSWFQIIKFEIDQDFDKWISSILAIIKSIFVGGLIFLALLISSLPVIVDSARNSLSYYFFKDISASIYKTTIDTFGGLFPGEPVNEDVFKRVDEIKQL